MFTEIINTKKKTQEKQSSLLSKNKGILLGKTRYNICWSLFVNFIFASKKITSTLLNGSPYYVIS